MILAIYKLLGSIVHLVLLPIGLLLWATGSSKWRDRLGLIRIDGPYDVWIHASSMGEVHVVKHLVDFLLRERPGLKIYLTTMTQTGHDAAAKLMPESVRVGFLPLDTPLAVASTFRRIRPRVLAIAETEIWPSLISAASARSVSIVQVNGRMTEKALQSYLRLESSFRYLLSKHNRFFFKSQPDADRYARLGVGSDRGEVAGDMKFDAPLLPRDPGEIALLRSSLRMESDGFLFVAGSTRKGEDQLIVKACERLLRQYQSLRIALVPRHIERSAQLLAELKAIGASASLIDEFSGSERVLLVDKMGVLNQYYLAADLAFVGGTLVPIGGHNLLEPVWAGTPVAFGPETSNVTEAAEYIEREEYGAQVKNAEELAELIEQCILGSRQFSTKEESDMDRSAVSRCGSYILEHVDA